MNKKRKHKDVELGNTVVTNLDGKSKNIDLSDGEIKMTVENLSFRDVYEAKLKNTKPEKLLPLYLKAQASKETTKLALIHKQVMVLLEEKLKGTEYKGFIKILDNQNWNEMRDYAGLLDELGNMSLYLLMVKIMHRLNERDRELLLEVRKKERELFDEAIEGIKNTFTKDEKLVISKTELHKTLHDKNSKLWTQHQNYMRGSIRRLQKIGLLNPIKKHKTNKKESGTYSQFVSINYPVLEKMFDCYRKGFFNGLETIHKLKESL